MDKLPSWATQALTIVGVAAVVIAHYAGHDLQPEVVAAILGPSAADAVRRLIAGIDARRSKDDA